MTDTANDFAKLASAIRERGPAAYMMTVAPDGRPHATYSPVRWEGSALWVEAGKQTVRNAEARPLVSLLFPVRTADDYSLFVDGTATVDAAAQRLIVRPTRAVLHRVGTPSEPKSSCGSDCIPLFTASAP